MRPSPEDRIVIRRADNADHVRAVTPPVAAVAHGIQRGPHHEDSHDEQHHTHDRCAAGRRGRSIPAAVAAAAAAAQLCLGVEHIRLTEEGRHGAVIVAVIIGGLNGLAQLALLGIGHDVAHVVAAVDLPVAVLYQHQDHVVLTQSPRFAQFGGVVLTLPAHQLIDGGHGHHGVVLAVPAAVIVPDQLLRLVAQQTGIVADPLLVLHVQQRRGRFCYKRVLPALADKHGGSDGQHQHHQRHAALFKKPHTYSPF